MLQRLKFNTNTLRNAWRTGLKYILCLPPWTYASNLVSVRSQKGYECEPILNEPLADLIHLDSDMTQINVDVNGVEGITNKHNQYGNTGVNVSII